MSAKKSLRFVWLFAAAISSIFAVLSTQKSGIPQTPQPPVQKPTISIRSALVRVADSIKVPAELNGVLSELNFREGQMVKKGQEIGKIKNDDLAIRLNRAQIEGQIASMTAQNDVDIRFAQKSLQVSQAQIDRSQKSNRVVPGVVPESRINEQQLQVHRDTLSVEQAQRDQKLAGMQTQLKETDVQLSTILVNRASIRSPIEGMVVAVETKQGEWVEPGNTVVKIIRLDRLRVEGFLPAQSAGRVKVGDVATIKVNQPWLKNELFQGKVAFINPEANPVNSNVQVWVDVDNANLKLMPGLEATVNVQVAQ